MNAMVSGDVKAMAALKVATELLKSAGVLIAKAEAAKANADGINETVREFESRLSDLLSTFSLPHRWSGTRLSLRLPDGSYSEEVNLAGEDGQPGASAYDLAVVNGYVGTEAQWLQSLKGAPADTEAFEALGREVDSLKALRSEVEELRALIQSGGPPSVILQDLTLSGRSYKTTDAEGTLVGEIEGLTEGSSLAFTPNDNRLAISRTGTTARLLKGLGASSAGSFDLTLTETLASARNSPNPTTIRLTVADGNADPNPVGIFGFRKPTVAPTSFPGTMMAGAEVDATDASKWSRQNNDATLSIAPGNLAASGAQTALRFIGYTDEEQIGANERIAVVGKVESASGSISVSSNVPGSTTVTATSRLGWKQGAFTSTAAIFPRVALAFASGVQGHFSRLMGYNVTKLVAQKWFIVCTVGQSNFVGATAVADPAIDTPVEGCVVFPGSTNTYTGYAVGTPAIALDPVQHQTLNGQASAYGGGPSGSFCRELRKLIPADYTIVFVALNYNGEGFKANGLWNKLNTARSPIAYTNFWTRMREVWSLAPAGSVMGGLLMCGGESDLGSGNEVEWRGDSPSVAAGFPAFVREVRAEAGWGEVPLVISEIGMPLSDGNVQSMIALQRKLVTGSGDALEFTRCRYVPRPANWTLGSDNVHYDQATHRQRGVDVARALAEIVYGSSS